MSGMIGHFVCVSCALFAGVATTAQDERKTPVASSTLLARDGRGAIKREGVNYPYLLGLPVPISPQDIDMWCWLLNASDAQRAVIIAGYHSYREVEQERHLRDVQPLWDEAVDLWAQGNPAMSVALSREFAEMLTTKRRKAVRSVLEAESCFSIRSRRCFRTASSPW